MTVFQIKNNQTLKEFSEEHKTNRGRVETISVFTPFKRGINMEKTISKTSGKQPLKVFRAGQINASVWAKEVTKNEKTFVIHSVKIIKSYVDAKEDAWKETNSYDLNDLPKVLFVTQQAYEWIITASRAEDD